MNDYTEDYYLRGKELGISNYENYRWIPELTKLLSTKSIMR